MVATSQLVDNVLKRLEENVSSPKFFSRSEILKWVNEGYVLLNLISKRLTEQVAVTADQVKYHSVPSGGICVLNVNRVESGTVKRKLDRYTLASLENENPRWSFGTGVPNKWFPFGLTRYGLHPIPNGSATVSLSVLQLPAALTEGGAIDLEEQYVEALEDYAFHIARFKEGGAEFDQSLQEFLRFMKKAGATEKLVKDFADQESLSVPAKTGYRPYDEREDGENSV